jgi:hypothetical protein
MFVDSVVSVGTMCSPWLSTKEFLGSLVVHSKEPVPKPLICKVSLGLVKELSTYLNFVIPSVGVKCVELVVQYQTVLRVIRTTLMSGCSPTGLSCPVSFIAA